jgi:hypothetical protein
MVTYSSFRDLLILVNGAPTALTVHIPAGSTSLKIANADVSVNAGDLVAILADAQRDGSGVIHFSGSFEFRSE